MSDHDNDLDELVQQMKQQHHTPPAVPRDRMWAGIENARRGRLEQPRRQPAWRRWGLPAMAAAAVLLLGIAIGRLGVRPDAGPLVADDLTPPSVAAGPRNQTSPLVRHAAADLFNRADVLLTDLKVSSCTTRDAAAVPAWAGNLLVQTRLLLDTPLADNAETKTLLQDLELVLIRITGLSREDCARDVDLIRRDLETNATLDRLRLAAAGGESRFI